MDDAPEAERETKPKNTRESMSDRSAPGRRRILAIDDDPDTLMYLGDLFEANGYDTETAVDWKKAIECLATSRFDLIILDAGLPDINGFTIAETLKAELRLDIPIVIYSAFAGKKDIALGYEKGADAYVTKPSSMHELLDAVTNTIAAHATNGKRVTTVERMSR
jgi:DNA-binding response OmpR family regulator